MNMTQQAIRKVEDAYKLAEAHYKRSFTRVPVYFSNKMTRAAGYARFQYNRPVEIQLSSKLLQLNGKRFIDETPGHEAAHCIAYELYGDVGHGPEWKEVMRVIGQSPDRCHTMEVPKSGITYHCNCQEFDFTPQRHNKIQRGAKYTCRKCKAYIVKGTMTDTVKPTVHKVEQPTPKGYKEVTVNSDNCKTNADRVRLIIKHVKANNGNMDTIWLQQKDLAAQLNMKVALFRSYVKNNWSKV